MLVREGDERNATIDLWLAGSLAAIAGALNAAAFYAVGFFSANMTGNVSTLSDNLVLGRWTTALFYFAILLAFIFGAAGAAALIDAGRRRRTRRIYAYGILLEAILLTGIGSADLWLMKELRALVVVLGLAFAMGFQNAIGTRISDARVRTTHVSGLATDIGIELAAALHSLRQRLKERGTPHDFGRLRLQACTVMSFLTGGVAGVVLYRTIGGYLLILAAIVLFAIAMSSIAQARHLNLQKSVIRETRIG
jgi:uncharacterized membrane protein YoaK (UPF0700 family)